MPLSGVPDPASHNPASHNPTGHNPASHNPAGHHSGGCHCGNIAVSLRLSVAASHAPLRACACSFCRAHATRTIADRKGLVQLRAADWSLVERYQFGSRTADYIVCRRCGIYVAAVCRTASGLRAVVNVNCMSDRAAFTQPPAAPDYDGETTAARLDRRAANWMPATVHDGPVHGYAHHD
jgi:hypothetical protein